MKRVSTLIFLVNKIKSEVKSSSEMQCSKQDLYRDDKRDDFVSPELAVNAILNFARSLEVTKSKTVGELEWVLN